MSKITDMPGYTTMPLKPGQAQGKQNMPYKPSQGKPKYTPMPNPTPKPGQKLGPSNPSWSNLSSPVDTSTNSNRSVGNNIARTLESSAKSIAYPSEYGQ
jgi:hypothetical protein